MERIRFGEQEGPNGKITTVNGFLAIFTSVTRERCHLEVSGPQGGERALVIMDKATAGKLGAALLAWADDCEHFEPREADKPNSEECGGGTNPELCSICWRMIL